MPSDGSPVAPRPGARRVGAIDCGTNSIRLLVADVDPDGTLTQVDRETRIVRLGQGVDATRSLDPAAIARTLEATRAYAVRLRELGAADVRFVATSASRDARNAADFVEGVAAVCRAELGIGVRPEVIGGDEEARLSFDGATRGLAGRGVPGPYLVVDIGGGSTELVRGSARVEAARSVDVGAVRLTERHLSSDPPTPAEVAAALRDVDAALDDALRVVDPACVRTLVGLAGTVTSVTAYALGLRDYDPDRVHLASLDPATVIQSCTEIVGMTRGERLGLGFLDPGRADVLGAGALTWGRVVERVAARAPLERVVTSEHDILDGMALALGGAPA